MTLEEYNQHYKGLDSPQELLRKKLGYGVVHLTDNDCDVFEAVPKKYYSVYVHGYSGEYVMSYALCEKGNLYTVDADGNPHKMTVFRYVGTKAKLIKD